MEKFRVDQVNKRLAQWANKQVFLHLEVNPGAYWRGGTGVLQASHVKGEGPYRLYVELDNGTGPIQVDNLTHMELTDTLLVVLGLDESERLARTLELSLQPLLMRERETVVELGGSE